MGKPHEKARVDLLAQDRILAACRQEISTTGVRGLRVQLVAKRARVSLGLVYYHFKDRAGLLDATVDAVNRAALARSRKLGAGLAGADAVIEALVAEFGDAADVRVDSVVWNEIRGMAVFDADLQRSLAQTTHEWERSLAAALARAGVPDHASPTVTTLLTALVEGLSSRWLSGQVETAEAQHLVRVGARAILDATNRTDTREN